MEIESASRRARKAVIHALPRSVEIDEDRSRLVVNDVPVRARWVGEGWLRDVRRVLDEGNGEERPDILAARRMSPGARKAIAEVGLSWVDETGAAEIVVDSIVVSRPGVPVETPSEWSPSVLAVAEALLCDGEGTVRAMKETTGLSTGSCTRALQVLEDQGLLVSEAPRGRKSGRRVADPDRLLDAYASEAARQSASPRLRIGVPWRDPVSGLAGIGAKWDAAGTVWACTGTVAAAMIAPHLTAGASADVYVDAHTPAGLAALAAGAGLRPIEGGRLTIGPFPTVTARRLSERRGKLRVAPWPRIYADLRPIGVRGEEAAEHLREVVRGG